MKSAPKWIRRLELVAGHKHGTTNRFNALSGTNLFVKPVYMSLQAVAEPGSDEDIAPVRIGYRQRALELRQRTGTQLQHGEANSLQALWRR